MNPLNLQTLHNKHITRPFLNVALIVHSRRDTPKLATADILGEDNHCISSTLRNKDNIQHYLFTTTIEHNVPSCVLYREQQYDKHPCA